MNRLGILQVVSFFIFLFFQVIFLKNLSLFGTAFCFIYVGYLLLFPVETNSMALMAIGFALGISVDLFYISMGVHASATVLVAFLRKHWLNAITPQGGYDSGALPSIGAHGNQWFLIYSVPLIFIHHFAMFFIEIGGFHMFWFTLGKVVASTLFTTSSIIILQYLFSSKLK